MEKRIKLCDYICSYQISSEKRNEVIEKVAFNRQNYYLWLKGRIMLKENVVKRFFKFDRRIVRIETCFYEKNKKQTYVIFDE